MKIIITTFMLILLFGANLAAQTLKEGDWRGAIVYDTEEVPFIFEVNYKDDISKPIITIVNGKDRAEITDTKIEGDSLIFRVFAFDITIKAKIEGDKLIGTMTKHYQKGGATFKADYGKPRFALKGSTMLEQVEPKWEITFKPGQNNAYPALGLFEQDGNKISGTIITETSDLRFFEGVIEGNEMILSSFDGAHAFLIKAKLINDKWEGEMVFGNGYSEKWEGKYNPDAKIKDPLKIVTLGKNEVRPDFQKLSADGQPSIKREDYEGKVLLIQMFGTWCPNSWDQTKYLIDWYAKNKEREVAVLAVNHEANYSQEYGERRIAEYKDKLEIEYDVILGGKLSKAEAAKAFPFMDRIAAFPTLIVVDKSGYARYVYSFFTGPATGEYYVDFDEKLNAIVDNLIAE